MTRSLQGFLEELLGRSRVTLSGKPKVDRGASGIDGTIQVSPVPALADIRFVDPPGAVGRLQFASASFVQFGGVALHPAPNGGVVSRETSFHEQFLDVSIRKREPQIPTDGANNEFRFEVPPFEQRRPRFDHGIRCSLSDSFTQFLQHCRQAYLDLLEYVARFRRYLADYLGHNDAIPPIDIHRVLVVASKIEEMGRTLKKQAKPNEAEAEE
jgi:hypothetical protein